MKDEEDRRHESASPWERFDLLQRTVILPAGPRGVFRFKTFEKFNEWKKQYKDIAEKVPPEHDLP